MKLLQVSDLHIGKRLHDQILFDDQKYVLQQVIAIAEDNKVDGVLLGGDVYDRSIPGESAVSIFNDFITQLASRHIPVYCIAGNHDSGERLDFLHQLLKMNQVYIAGVEPDTIVCEDAYGPYAIHLFPFTRAEKVADKLEQLPVDTSIRNVMVAHQFVMGHDHENETCQSETYSIGGADNVSVNLFEKFDYTGLGHLHVPQKLAENVWYAGSPLMYSFSEAEKAAKCALLVEMKEKGTLEVTKCPLKPLHSLRIIRGPLRKLVAEENVEQGDCKDYIRAILTDEEELMEPMRALREVYPNILRLDIENSRTAANNSSLSVEHIENRSFMELFNEFYEKQNNQPMNEQEQKILEDFQK